MCIRDRPNIRFQIVGRNPSDELFEICKTAEITGEVESVQPYLEKAAVFCAPLRLAFGVQTKILEAMAAGIPVVATKKILNGLKARDGKDILCADSAEEFAEHCIELIKDKAKAKAISLNAINYIEKMHNADEILNDFEKIIIEKAAI